jgi:hypothetical protein
VAAWALAPNVAAMSVAMLRLRIRRVGVIMI